jgi:hypothetical protein
VPNGAAPRLPIGKASSRRRAAGRTPLKHTTGVALGAVRKVAEQFKHACGEFFTPSEVCVVVQARRERYAARQAYKRAGTALDRLQRRVREMSGRLDRMQE